MAENEPTDPSDFTDTYPDDTGPGLLDFSGHLREQLSEALRDPALRRFNDGAPSGVRELIEKGPGSDVARAAYRLAVALGKCRLFSVEPGDDLDGSLPVGVAAAAAIGAAHVARLAAARADALREMSDALDADEEEEGEDADDEREDAACTALEARTDLWAADVAIGETYTGAAIAGDPDVFRLGEAVDALAVALDALDAKLGARIDALSVAAGTNLLDNWRGMLAPPYREAPPWWLDGTLEAEVDRVTRYCLSWSPTDARLPGATVGTGRLPVGLPPIDSTLYLAGPKVAKAPSELRRVWTSPDGRYEAVMLLPNPLDPANDERFVINFDPAGPAGAEGTDPLVGQPVLLGEASSQIDADGRAWFTLGALLAAGDVTVLTVNGVKWTLVTE